MREVVFRIRHRGEPESEVSAEFPDVTLRSVSSMTGSGNERKRIIEINGDPAEMEQFLERFREADPIIEAQPLSPLQGSRAYVAIVFDIQQWDSISERLSDIGVHYRMGTTVSNGWERWTLYLDDADRLSEVIERLEEGGNDVRLVKNVELSDVTMEPQLEASQLLVSLTPRQRDALGTAIETGYYGIDRETTVERIATDLGVAQTTAWEHLVRAEAKVMSEVGYHLE